MILKGDCMKYRLGVDIGGTTISVGIVDFEGEIIAKNSIYTLADMGHEKVISRMIESINELVISSKIGVENIKSIGIGCPGELDRENGMVLFSNNIDWFDVPLKSYVENKLDLPVLIENDANCAALGEFHVGSGQRYNNMIMVTLGTGIGGSVIIDKKLYLGKNGGANIIGHTVIQMDGKQCNCGRKGCWECYASVSALIEQAVEISVKYPGSILASVRARDGELNGKNIFEAVRSGDIAARELFDGYVGYVAIGMVNLVNIFDPDVIVIGGGISREKEFLIDPVTRIVEKDKYCRSIKPPFIKASKLGNDAGLIGAAFLGNY